MKKTKAGKGRKPILRVEEGMILWDGWKRKTVVSISEMLGELRGKAARQKKSFKGNNYHSQVKISPLL